MPTQTRKTILLATDQQNSTLVALNENQPQPSAYTPYGHRALAYGLIGLGFNGELPDPLTGNYHLGKGYRQFNPTLMKFNIPDSFSPFGVNELNAYAYCGGDPINRFDPTGHWYKAIGKSLGFRPKAAANKAMKANRILDEYPSNHSFKETKFFDNDAAKDGKLGLPFVVKTKARARDNKLYITRLVKNKSFEFHTEASASLHNGVIIQKNERLVSISNLSMKPEHLDYLTNIQNALSTSKKGLTRSQIDKIKHSATIIREINDSYKLEDILNRNPPSRWGDAPRHDRNYWSEK